MKHGGAESMKCLAIWRRPHPKWGMYTTTGGTMSLLVQLFNPLGRIHLV
jgi:hypothetical protein